MNSMLIAGDYYHPPSQCARLLRDTQAVKQHVADVGERAPAAEPRGEECFSIAQRL